MNAIMFGDDFVYTVNNRILGTDENFAIYSTTTILTIFINTVTVIIPIKRPLIKRHIPKILKMVLINP